MATAEEPLPQIPASLRFDVETGEHDDGLSAFVLVRPHLFGIAYHMLGSAAEAEDIVQDVWLRWQFTNRSAVESPPAFLATTTTRLCINLAQSAHTNRETYIGTWFPEPVDISSDPELGAERAEALKLAVLVLLAKLSPRERAATFCVKRSITPSARSRVSCKCRKQTSANSSPAPANISQMVGARPSIRVSSGAFWLRLSRRAKGRYGRSSSFT
jgi:DNA-directed RNA polymerase specialized sigma24 family protein